MFVISMHVCHKYVSLCVIYNGYFVVKKQVLNGGIYISSIKDIWLDVYHVLIFYKRYIFVTLQFFTNDFSSRGSTLYSNGWAMQIILTTLPRDLSRKKIFFSPLSPLKQFKKQPKILPPFFLYKIKLQFLNKIKKFSYCLYLNTPKRNFWNS